MEYKWEIWYQGKKLGTFWFLDTVSKYSKDYPEVEVKQFVYDKESETWDDIGNLF